MVITSHIGIWLCLIIKFIAGRFAILLPFDAPPFFLGGGGFNQSWQMPFSYIHVSYLISKRESTEFMDKHLVCLFILYSKIDAHNLMSFIVVLQADKCTNFEIVLYFVKNLLRFYVRIEFVSLQILKRIWTLRPITISLPLLMLSLIIDAIFCTILKIMECAYDQYW